MKKVERLMALTFIMTLCLLVYAACEYHLRKVLAEKELTVPDQKKKPTQRPTMRWVFAVVRGDSYVGGSRGPQTGVECEGA
ncbi:MAG: transposase, partial [Myxococcota bacterium]